jgi:hypothetical protein
MRYYVEEFSKSASQDSKDVLDGVMQRIYKEAPWKWPHGLSMAGHDDIYLVRDSASENPVGFVGWQERDEGHTKVGYYTIGILPEYRNEKRAKKAVSQLLQIKSASVDTVKAYIVEGNKESLALASTLDIPVRIKKANTLQGARAVASAIDPVVTSSNSLARILASAGGTAAAHDLLNKGFEYKYVNPENKSFGELYGNVDDPMRWAMAGLNSAIGAGFGTNAAIQKLGGGGAVSAMASVPIVKDLAFAARPVVSALPQSLENLKPLETKTDLAPVADALKTVGAVGAGVGAAGIGTYALLSALKAYREKKDREKGTDQGKIRVTLPTKNPNDQETSIEIPFSQIPMSASLQARVQRDFRNRLRKETLERTKRKKPKDVTNITPPEAEVLDILREEEEENKKAASATPAAKSKTMLDYGPPSPVDILNQKSQMIGAQRKYQEELYKMQRFQKKMIQERKDERVQKAQKIHANLSSLNVFSNNKKVAGVLGKYDPMIGKGNTTPKDFQLPPGAPASMANSVVAPYSTKNVSTNTPEVPDTSAADKKLEKLQEENVKLKIEQRAREIADKKVPSSSSTSSTGTSNISGISSRLAHLKSTLNGVKTASVMPPPAVGPFRPVPQGATLGPGDNLSTANTPVGSGKLPYTKPSMNHLNSQVRMHGGKLPEHKQGAGIQVPLMHQSMPFASPMATQLWHQARNVMMPVQPSARAMFMERNAPQVGWGERLGGLMQMALQNPQMFS